MRINKKTILIASLCGGMIFMQSFVPLQHNEKATNLKVLPKDISEKELHDVMRTFSKSLGVHCDFCHVKMEGQMEGGRPKMDFAADTKPEKNTARDMMRMTMAINNDHISKMKIDGHKMEEIACVTCHMGRTSPIVSVDSLPGQNKDRH